MTRAKVPVALTIAGSDSGGGAGVQGDLKTFAAFKVHGLSAITAITSQSTLGLKNVHPVSADVVREQIEVVFDDFAFRFAKTGMLLGADVVRVVASFAEKNGIDLVVDPVMIAKDGTRLLEENANPVLVRELFPRAKLVTPNLPEAEELIGERPTNEHDMIDAAKKLLELGPQAVLLKGGHLAHDPVDVLFERGREPIVLRAQRVNTLHTHGTGCAYSAAIVALLALGEPLSRAVSKAHAHVQKAIEAAAQRSLGHGKGPIHTLFAWDEPGLDLI